MRGVSPDVSRTKVPLSALTGKTGTALAVQTLEGHASEI
jgi:hypothetical protein